MFATVTLVEKTCGECGIHFAFPETFDNELHREGPKKSWYCPNGHERVYTESTADRLKREMQAQIEERDRQLANLRDDLRVEAASRVKVERKLKRVQAGVCPECHRTFQALGRHMATKHPVKRA